MPTGTSTTQQRRSRSGTAGRGGRRREAVGDARCGASVRNSSCSGCWTRTTAMLDGPAAPRTGRQGRRRCRCRMPQTRRPCRPVPRSRRLRRTWCSSSADSTGSAVHSTRPLRYVPRQRRLDACFAWPPVASNGRRAGDGATTHALLRPAASCTAASSAQPLARCHAASGRSCPPAGRPAAPAVRAGYSVHGRAGGRGSKGHRHGPHSQRLCAHHRATRTPPDRGL